MYGNTLAKTMASRMTLPDEISVEIKDTNII
jgi:hypothetical protein